MHVKVHLLRSHPLAGKDHTQTSDDKMANENTPNPSDDKPKFMKNEDGTPMTQDQLRAKYGVDFTKERKDGKLQYGPDDPTAMSNRVQFLAKADSQYYDPCAEASKMSLSCLERNNYKKAMCEEYFQIYRDCKKQWVSIIGGEFLFLGNTLTQLEQRRKDKKSGFLW